MGDIGGKSNWVPSITQSGNFLPVENDAADLKIGIPLSCFPPGM